MRPENISDEIPDSGYFARLELFWLFGFLAFWLANEYTECDINPDQENLVAIGPPWRRGLGGLKELTKPISPISITTNLQVFP